jgi:lipopolysaccharide heptosyltransferase II
MNVAAGTLGWRHAERVLCVRLDNMGDVLMTTPALRALRRGAAGRRLTLLASRSGAAVAPFVPDVDEVIVFDAPWMKPRGSAPRQDLDLVAELRKRRFDAAVIFTVYSQSPLPAAYLCYLAGIPLRLAHCRENPYGLLTDWVPDPEPREHIRHEVRRQLDLAKTIGCRTDDERLSFTVPPRARAAAQRVLARAGIADCSTLIVVHPGASAASRRYPALRYAQAMDLLLQRIPEAAVIYTGSADEAALVETIRKAMARASHSLVGQLDVAELGALLERASLLVANNTGPVHIAAALGTPVVDLYALTNPQHAPWQVRSEILFCDVPCRFCYRSVCPAGHHACLAGVEPQAVAAAAERLLNEPAAGAAEPLATSPLALYAAVH